MPSAKTFESLVFQDRDLALFRDLFECRIMTGAHIASLHFDGSKEAAKKRLQKLKSAGLIQERPRMPSEPAVLSLTRDALILLKERGILHDYPPHDFTALVKRTKVSSSTVAHEIEVMDVKAAFHAAMRKQERFTIAEFSTWPLLHQFEISRGGYGTDMTVKPDGFIRIHEKEPDGGVSEHAFFLEVDRSSETLDTLIGKAVSYLHYYKSGGFALRHGATRDAYKEFPFRVLMVIAAGEKKRRNDVAQLLLHNTPPIFTQVCLAMFNEVTADPLGSIWITPAVYRDALKATLFDTDRFQRSQIYRRQTERENLVEQRVKKSSLVTG
jgi:hypothetical protein